MLTLPVRMNPREHTLCPACVITKCGCGEEVIANHIFLSDDTENDGHMSDQIFDKAMIEVLRTNPNLADLFFWSDNCSPQFKSRLPFRLLSAKADRPYRIHRNFFGPQHGKTAAGQAIASRQYEISNAQTMLEFCRKEQSEPSGYTSECNHMHRYNTFHLIGDLTERRHLLTTAMLYPPNGIQRLLSYQITSLGILTGKNLSCFCSGCKASTECRWTEQVDPEPTTIQLRLLNS